MHRYYRKEEEFLDEFYNWAAAAASITNGEWRPNDTCDDNARKQNEYFMKTGQMSWLVFTGASISDGPEGVHAQIVLESSTRIVTIKVGERDGRSEAKILIDRVK